MSIFFCKLSQQDSKYSADVTGHLYDFGLSFFQMMTCSLVQLTQIYLLQCQSVRKYISFTNYILDFLYLHKQHCVTCYANDNTVGVLGMFKSVFL